MSSNLKIQALAIQRIIHHLPAKYNQLTDLAQKSIETSINLLSDYQIKQPTIQIRSANSQNR